MAENIKPEEKNEKKAKKLQKIKEKKSKDKSKGNKKFNGKKLKHGAMATAFTCVFIAVVVLVNIIATIIFDKYPITLDLTENKIYSISDEAKEYVKTIGKEVNVTVLATRDEFESFADEYTKSAAELLDKYCQYNDKITVKYVDFLSNPELLSDYADQENLGAYDIIFETSSTDSEGNTFKRVKVVGLMDMVNISDEVLEYYVSSGYDESAIDTEIETYVANYGHYQTFNLYYSYGMLGDSNAETAFVSALMSVASENSVTVTFLNADRKEAELTYFKSLLDANGYIVNEINISTQEIPEDTDIIVMGAPKLDYTADEIAKVDKFLENGGELGKNLIYMASVEQGDTPNIDEFLEEYGIVIEKDVIGEFEEGYYYGSNPYLTVQDLVGEYYLDTYDGADGAYFYVPYSRAITPLYEEDGMKTVWKYLSSSSNAYLVNSEDSTDYEQVGNLYSMVIGAKCRFDTQEDGDYISIFSQVIAFGTEGFFADSALASSTFENSDLIITMLNEITNKEQSLVITPKKVSAVTFDINEKQATTLKYVYVFVIPAVILIIGLVVYLRRKNK